MIDNFTRDNIKFVRNMIQLKLDELEEMGLTVKLGNISYTSKEFKSSLTVNIGSEDDGREIRWKKHCWKYGLLTEHFQETFELHGELLQIWDIKERKCKYPILCKKLESGEIFRYTTESLRYAKFNTRIEG